MSVVSTVVFADISGSVALFETLGNERATEAVTQVTQWIGATIESHGGRVVKSLGDGVLAIFGDATTAVTAMVTMLRRHDARLDRWPERMRLHVRVGIASGEVVDVDGDCFGDAVNMASRLCERSGPAEIWATESTVLLAGTTTDAWFRKLGTVEIRGRHEPLTLYQVAWRENEAPEALTMHAGLPSNFAPAESPRGQIRFAWRSQERAFSAAQTPVQLGRAPQTQLCLDDPRVSRLHARIDWRNGGFVLTDMSSFGTWVRFDGVEAPVRLRRDSCILHGRGEMALGVSFTEPTAPVVRFDATASRAPAA